jgi:hypothetical protein
MQLQLYLLWLHFAALKFSDIDSKRMQLFVERAKGKKGRYVNLSPVLPDNRAAGSLQYKNNEKIFACKQKATGKQNIQDWIVLTTIQIS